MAGTERSHLDPPVVSAVPPITDRNYTKKQKKQLRFRLQQEDHLNITQLPFEVGELVFIKHDEVNQNNYLLPLSVAKVREVRFTF